MTPGVWPPVVVGVPEVVPPEPQAASKKMRKAPAPASSKRRLRAVFIIFFTKIPFRMPGPLELARNERGTGTFVLSKTVS